MANAPMRCKRGDCTAAIAYAVILESTNNPVAALCAEHGTAALGQVPAGYRVELINPPRPLKMQPKPDVAPAPPPEPPYPRENLGHSKGGEQKGPTVTDTKLPQVRLPIPEDEQMDTAPLTALAIKQQVQLIQEVMQAVMQEGYHYGVIPGTEKPTLLKPGAEKLTTTFRLAPLLNVEWRDFPGGHRECEVRCTLVHIPTSRVYGEGVGLCSTMESRYRYRKAERSCPFCGRETVIKGKAEYGGGWLCFQRKGGCGAKFADQDPTITSQPTGRVENTDLADTYNTVLKMAKKRALVDATLTATAASDIFTQDLEDYTAPEIAEIRPSPVPPQAASRPAQPQAQPAPQLQPQVQPPQDTGRQDTVNNRLITKGQLEILLLSQRRSKISDAEFKRYLADTHQVVDLKELKQSAVNTILEWLEEKREQRVPQAELQAQEGDQSPPPWQRREAAPGRVISEGQRRRLHAIRNNSRIPEEGLHQWLQQTYAITSTGDIPVAQYDAICTAMEDGTVMQWLHEFAEKSPEWEPGANG